MAVIIFGAVALLLKNTLAVSGKTISRQYAEVVRNISYKQVQRRYGIQGCSTVLSWCQRYATYFVTFQQTGPTSPGTAPAVDSASK